DDRVDVRGSATADRCRVLLPPSWVGGAAAEGFSASLSARSSLQINDVRSVHRPTSRRRAAAHVQAIGTWPVDGGPVCAQPSCETKGPDFKIESRSGIDIRQKFIFRPRHLSP